MTTIRVRPGEFPLSPDFAEKVLARADAMIGARRRRTAALIAASVATTDDAGDEWL